MSLKPLEEPDKLLDAAFGRGRKAARTYKKQATPFYTIKGKEIGKIDKSAEYLIDRLTLIVTEFPNVNKLDPFYQDLYSSVIDIDEIKKALSSISSVSKLIKTIRRESIVDLKELRYEKGSIDRAKQVSKKYFGRTSSLIKGLDKQIKSYNASVKKLRELPSIDTKEELYLLAGLPNVGKSTLLGKITSSKPKVASFPFTTKGLNVGYFIKKHLPVQVIDTPGLLDRELHKRNKIELKAINAFQHLKGTIIFIVDPVHSLDKQQNLLRELKKLFTEKGFMVVINKSDLVSEEELDRVKKLFSDYFIIIEGEGLDNLRKELVE
ncbi:MAG: GTP-binding protein [Candidatus Diapherotrites archaeon]|jgi:nucleolar GTP-binding protein|uniref:GTP-binding protein n=1 Tax=Candidatus Iainarchaeum sp. TaxID=3101447 RepID=A0A8T5GFV1_9ARCH|nr:GTP-binding protein [Candidatus Diapherotrites archaeon]MBT7241533.1 GTP-binding protein [Candidatus Diapherotrites archaeon]